MGDTTTQVEEEIQKCEDVTSLSVWASGIKDNRHAPAQIAALLARADELCVDAKALSGLVTAHEKQAFVKRALLEHFIQKPDFPIADASEMAMLMHSLITPEQEGPEHRRTEALLIERAKSVCTDEAATAKVGSYIHYGDLRNQFLLDLYGDQERKIDPKAFGTLWNQVDDDEESAAGVKSCLLESTKTSTTTPLEVMQAAMGVADSEEQSRVLEELALLDKVAIAYPNDLEMLLSQTSRREEALRQKLIEASRFVLSPDELVEQVGQYSPDPTLNHQLLKHFTKPPFRIETFAQLDALLASVQEGKGADALKVQICRRNAKKRLSVPKRTNAWDLCQMAERDTSQWPQEVAVEWEEKIIQAALWGNKIKDLKAATKWGNSFSSLRGRVHWMDQFVQKHGGALTDLVGLWMWANKMDEMTKERAWATDYPGATSPSDLKRTIEKKLIEMVRKPGQRTEEEQQALITLIRYAEEGTPMHKLCQEGFQMLLQGVSSTRVAVGRSRRLQKTLRLRFLLAYLEQIGSYTEADLKALITQADTTLWKHGGGALIQAILQRAEGLGMDLNDPALTPGGAEEDSEAMMKHVFDICEGMDPHEPGDAVAAMQRMRDIFRSKPGATGLGEVLLSGKGFPGMMGVGNPPFDPMAFGLINHLLGEGGQSFPFASGPGSPFSVGDLAEAMTQMDEELVNKKRR